MRLELRKCLCRLSRHRSHAEDRGERITYLAKWFTPEILADIERLRHAAQACDEPAASLFLVTASDLLRDWSLQDPGDLRIRRRRTPLPETPFQEAWKAAVIERLAIIEQVQPLFVRDLPQSHAMLADSRDSAGVNQRAETFDFAITSPPYATALPYIDTQRLSLVWLGLVGPEEIRSLEAGVLGSREVLSGRKLLVAAMADNQASLPDEVAEFCRRLQSRLGKSDGFRRQAVPLLLYRYLSGMKAAFSNLHRLLRTGGRMAWVVGVNQTTLGGEQITIDTPELLGRLAAQAGFAIAKPIVLQTYHRYSIHQKNSIRQESVILFQK